MDTLLGREAPRGRIEQTFPTVECGLAVLDNYWEDRPALRIQMSCRDCGLVLDKWRNHAEGGRLWRGRDWLTRDGEPRHYGIVVVGETDLEDEWLRDQRRNQSPSGRFVYRCHELCRPDGRPGQLRVLTRRELAGHIDTAATAILDHVDLGTDNADTIRDACVIYGRFTI